MPVTVVVGAQWGDEGKAKVIDLLAKEHAYVVRYQGGHNAGHTVVVGGEPLRPAAHRRAACSTTTSCPVIGNGVVVDLPTLFAEIDALELAAASRAHGCRCRAGPTSSSRGTRPTTRIAEAMRGDDKIGTTLKGIGPAYADKARRVGIRAGDVLDPDAFAEHGPGPGGRREQRDRAGGGDPLDVDDVVARFAELGAPAAPLRRRHRHAAPRRARAGRPRPAGRRPGHVPRPRPRHLPLRHVVEPDGRRARAPAPASGRATSTASSASPRRTRRASAPARSRPS